MHLTVAICTWNRSHLLARTLEHLERIRVPPGVTWELLVVNNNCTDDTDAVVARHADRLPLRPVFEPRPGLSHARNAAIAHATGRYIVYTDDDVLVAPEWLAAYAQGFADDPDAVLFAGPVYPNFEAPSPTWLPAAVEASEELRAAYALKDLGPERLPLDPDLPGRLPVGANYAVRLQEHRHALYDPQLGRVGSVLVSGEETTLARQLLCAGHRGWYLPDAAVRHFVPSARQSLSYLRRFFWGIGATSVRAKLLDTGAPRLLGVPRWALRAAVEHEIRYRATAFANPARWIRHFVQAASAQGIVREAVRGWPAAK